MTIKQGLKQKNKLVKKIQEEYEKVSRYNSLDEGANRPYDVEKALENYLKLTNELVELKSKIHFANAPIYNKIFRLSELKSIINNLKAVDCTEGKYVNRWEPDNAQVKTVIISILQKDTLIESMEEEIEEIQDELDRYNSTTEI